MVPVGVVVGAGKQGAASFVETKLCGLAES